MGQIFEFRIVWGTIENRVHFGFTFFARVKMLGIILGSGVRFGSILYFSFLSIFSFTSAAFSLLLLSLLFYFIF